MRKLFLMGFMLAMATATLPAEGMITASKAECCPEYPRGPKGKKGPRGSKGERGRRGARGTTGPIFRINDILEVTSTSTAVVLFSEAVPFNPVVFPTTGITAGVVNGLALIEAVPMSGVFNTISLPASTVETYYSVTYGFSIPEDFFGNFVLLLNGTPLPYTEVTNSTFSTGLKLTERTSIIITLASNVPGTLTLVNQAADVALTPVTPTGFSAYITIVKLNEAP